MNRTARYYLPPVLWMGAIFVLSTSLFSGRGTGSILQAVLSLFGPHIGTDIIDAINYLMRKAAHLSVYAVLAVLWTRALVLGRGMPLRRAVTVALVISALYAMTDEYHQSFVPERDASPYDGMVDSIGAGLGAVLAGRYRPGWIFSTRNN